jgi:hypothetical protein
MSDTNELKTAEVEEAEEEYEEYEDEEEYDEDDEERVEDYERWAGSEESTFHFKPLVIGLVIAGIVGVGAVVFATSISDPADKFDSAPIIQDPSEDDAPLSISGESERTFTVEMPEDRPRPARADDGEEEIELSASEPDQAATPVPAVVEVTPPEAEEPVAQPEPEAVEPPPAETAPVAAPADYTDVLEQARKERNRKKKQDLLRQAIEINPSGDEALATLAMLLMERGKTRVEALDLATRAVEANPDNGLGWLVIGYVKQVIGKAAEAKEAYRKCAGCSGPKKYVRECRQLG